MHQLTISLFYATVSDFIILCNSYRFNYLMQQLVILLFYASVNDFIIL